MSRYMLPEPGAIPDPTKAIAAGPTKSTLRAWNVSDAEEMSGAKTA